MTSENLLKFVPSKHYLVVVPQSDVALFRRLTDPKFQVVPETAFTPTLKTRLLEMMSVESRTRVGWYLQQFIKLNVLKTANEQENFVIWDADTIPLKPINFFLKSGEVEFFSGTENNPPYFEVTRKIIGSGKIAPFSFIAQCFPCKGYWAHKFFDYIEEKFQSSFEHVLLNTINFDEGSGFSEYETLGSFIYLNFRDQVLLKPEKWFRYGAGLVGYPNNINRQPHSQLIKDYAHITFERWDEPYSILNKQKDDFKRQFLNIESGALPSLETFLRNLFSSGDVRSVVQIGANDGIQNDPLRQYLVAPGNYHATLVEPIPFYIESLRNLYANRRDVRIVQAAVGSIESQKKLFFIPPGLAHEMNGEGPPNNWAHGQGSFSRATVEHWIKANAFRGKRYNERIDDYMRSIDTVTVDVVSTESILASNRCGMLVLIDVQGFELDVLLGIDWSNPPQWIIVEDDLGKSIELIKFFNERGFQWIAGEHDKVFGRAAR